MNDERDRSERLVPVARWDWFERAVEEMAATVHEARISTAVNVLGARRVLGLAIFGVVVEVADLDLAADPAQALTVAEHAADSAAQVTTRIQLQWPYRPGEGDK